MASSLKNSDQEFQKDSPMKSPSSYSSLSFEINPLSSDLSSTTGSIADQSSHSDTKGSALIEFLNNPELSYQNFSSSGDSKYGSLSSCYPSTLGSSHGTSPNALSSPEQLQSPFIRPTKGASAQKFSEFSSDSTSSDNAKDMSPKRKFCLKASSDVSVSSGESQSHYSEHNIDPDDLSSREVTHLETPDLRSTSAEESFSCFQLSGESSKRVSSSFSLPDPFHPSPSNVGLTEHCSDTGEQHVASLEEAEKPVVNDEKLTIDSLPKWVKSERKKQIGTMSEDRARNSSLCRSVLFSFSESTDSSISLHSTTSSPLCGVVLPDKRCEPVVPVSPGPSVPESQHLPSAHSQNIYLQRVNEEDDYKESCVYPLKDYPMEAKYQTTDSLGASKDASSSPCGNTGGNDELDISSPGFILPSQSSALSINSKAVLKMPSTLYERSSDKHDGRSRHEMEPEEIELSPVLDEHKLSQVQNCGATGSGGKGVELTLNKDGSLSKGSSVERLQEDFPRTAVDKDDELEMSQDLFNSGIKEANLEDRNQEFSLFLSQTQNELSQRLEFQPTRTTSLPHGASFNQTDDMQSSDRCSRDECKEPPPVAGRQSSFDNTITTPSQSILPSDQKSEPPSIIRTPAEPDQNEAKGLEIPSDVLNKVSSNEMSFSNLVHMPLPSNGASFRPTKTLTPPLRSIDMEIDSNREIGDLSEERRLDVSQECVPPLYATKDPQPTPFQSRETKGAAGSDEMSATPKVSKLLMGDVHVETANDFSTEQNSTIYTKALKTSVNVAKQGFPTSKIDNDPFAFNEEEKEDDPSEKHHTTAVASSSNLPPNPMQPVEVLTQSDADSLCRVVSQIVTVKEVTTVLTRRFITEIFGMDGSIIRRTEFLEKGSPVKTVVEESDLPTVEVVPQDNLKSKMDREKYTEKRTAKSQASTKASQKSPGDRSSHKRRRSSSSTPPSGSTGIMKRRRAEQEFTTDEFCPDEPGGFAPEAGDKKNTRSKKKKARCKKDSEPSDSSISVGMNCFGRWLDNRYYPGKIIEVTRLGSYRTKFHDEKELQLPASAIIPQYLIQTGQSVFARSSHDGFYYRGTINRINRKRDGTHSSYHVKLKDSERTKSFNVDDIMLDAKQMLQVKSKVKEKDATNFAEPEIVGAELAEGLRKQKQRRFYDMEKRREDSIPLIISSSSPEIDPFHLRVRPKRRKNEPSSDQQCSTSSGTQIFCEVRKIRDPEEKMRERWKRIENLKKDPGCEEKLRLYGSLPEDPTLFKGYMFLITSMPSKSDADEDIAFRCTNFKRLHLACQLTAGGGSVVDSVKNIKNVPDKTFVLVAPTHQKTIKYYFALCYGFPCVSHFWVIDSCKENRLLPFEDYLLEAGLDQITSEVVPPHRRIQPLRGFKIFVKALKENQDEYSLVVKFSGAQVVADLPNVKNFCTGDVDFILLVDNVVPNKGLLSLSKRLGIPCVTLKWFYQCVIHGEFIHPKSSYLFTAREP